MAPMPKGFVSAKISMLEHSSAPVREVDWAWRSYCTVIVEIVTHGWRGDLNTWPVHVYVWKTIQGPVNWVDWLTVSWPVKLVDYMLVAAPML